MEAYTLSGKKSKEKNSRPSPIPGAFAPGIGRSSLPCLYSNNSTEPPQSTPPEESLQTVTALCNLLSPYHRRQGFTLYSNVERLLTRVAPSVDHVAFVTLTFKDNIEDPKEAYNRFRSLNSHFLSQWEITDWVCVKERQKRGSWHYHLVCVFKEDVRTGIDFEQIAKGNYSSASPYLRRIWKELREALPKYGFGRSEVLPVKSNAEAMSRYIGKYVSKHIDQREEQDKGVRLVNYSRGWERNSVDFAWHTANSQEWRRKVALFAQYCGCTEIYQLSDKLGPGWAYRYAGTIMEIDSILEASGGELSAESVDPTIARLLGPDPLRVAWQEKSFLQRNGSKKPPRDLDPYYGYPF